MRRENTTFAIHTTAFGFPGSAVVLTSRLIDRHFIATKTVLVVNGNKSYCALVIIEFHVLEHWRFVFLAGEDRINTWLINYEQ